MSKAVSIRITQDQLALIAHALGKVEYSAMDDFPMRESFFVDTVQQELDSLNQMCLELSTDPAPDTTGLYGFCI
jgi:hypothetical protein